MTLQIKDKIIPFKIGLKGSMMLNENANLNAEKDTDFIIYCGLLSHEPSISLKDLRELNIPAGDRIELAKTILAYPHPDDERIKQLYSIAIGEIGVNPDAFWNMTEEEVLTAYEGYVQRMETSVNLMLAAFRKIIKGDTEFISLKEDKGYTAGSVEEREQVFANLGIKE